MTMELHARGQCHSIASGKESGYIFIKYSQVLGNVRSSKIPCIVHVHTHSLGTRYVSTRKNGISVSPKDRYQTRPSLLQPAEFKSLINVT